MKYLYVKREYQNNSDVPCKAMILDSTRDNLLVWNIKERLFYKLVNTIRKQYEADTDLEIKTDYSTSTILLLKKHYSDNGFGYWLDLNDFVKKIRIDVEMYF